MFQTKLNACQVEVSAMSFPLAIWSLEKDSLLQGECTTVWLQRHSRRARDVALLDGLKSRTLRGHSQVSVSPQLHQCSKVVYGKSLWTYDSNIPPAYKLGGKGIGDLTGFRNKFRLLVLFLVLLALAFNLPLRILGASSGTGDNPVQITRTGCPSAQNCSFGNYPTESSFALPFTQQKIFQNPRPSSQQDFYVFYATNVSLAGSGCTSNGAVTNLCYECVYAYSPDGVGWRVNQTIGSGPAGVGNFYINCSAAYFDDAANNQLIVYVVATRNAGSVNLNHNVEFVIGTVSDSADGIACGPVQTVSRSSSTQNFQFPVIQVDPNGYPQIAYSWVDTSVNRQTVDLCSSRIAHPTSNSSWTCNGGNGNSLFNAQTQSAQTAASFMPQLQPVPGHSVLVLKGPCSSIATSACTPAVTLTENATLVDWNGTTQSFKPTSTFTYPASSSSDRRSSTLDRATGNFYLAYHNGTDDRFWTRLMAKPYTGWSNPSRVTGDSGQGRILLLSGTGTAGALVFIEATDTPKLVSGGGGSGTCGSCPSINMYVNTTTTGTAWSTATTLYSNTTWTATWANTPWIVNTTTNNKLPIMWEQHVCGNSTNVPCTTQPEELWFDPHILYTPSSSQLKPSFVYAPTTPTVGQTVTFTATASGGTSPYSYSWSFGDGTSGTGSTTSHAYSSAGSYTATLTVVDRSVPPQSATSQQTVTVKNPTPLSASFTFTPSSPQAGQQITFKGTATGGTSPYSFSWTFGDNSTGTGTTVSHTFDSAGSYTVTLTVQDSSPSQQTAASQQSVSVSSPPQTLTVSFAFNSSSPKAGQQVTFAGFASGGTSPYAYAWSFGDNSTGTGASTTHTYSLAGSYRVTLTVVDSGSPQQTATSEQTITVVNPPPPALTAAFTFTPANPHVGQTVSFTGSASGGTQPATYSWPFGDSGTGSGSSVTHAYQAAGSHTVVLTVTDAAGQTARSTQTVTVSNPPPPTLTVSFAFNSSSPKAGQQVTFAGFASGGTPPYAYTWSFGDNSTGTGASTTHTYSLAGSYRVTFTVVDSGSPQQTATSEQTITVVNPPPPLSAGFTFSPASPDAGQSVSFTASASGGTSPYNYSWSFGDGGTASGIAVSHSFTSSGSYTVTLRVTDSGSQTAQASKTVTVNPQLSGSFSYSPSSPLPLQPVTFTATGSGGAQPYSYSWHFGDGTTANGQSVSHSYLLPGSYVVTLTITDANHQTFTTSQTIIILTNL